MGVVREKDWRRKWPRVVAREGESRSATGVHGVSVLQLARSNYFGEICSLVSSFVHLFFSRIIDLSDCLPGNLCKQSVRHAATIDAYLPTF